MSSSLYTDTSINDTTAPNVIAVVYLCWMPFGLDCFSSFLTSYKQFQAGASHDLIIIFKGGGDVWPYLQLLHKNVVSFQQLNYIGTGLDIDTYYWCAGKLLHDKILFLNSKSQFLASDWLQKFVKAYTADVGVISATGSWQSFYTSLFETNSWWWTKKMTRKQNVGKYKLMLEAALLWRFYFRPFPNPHIRTNGFFIRRNLFIGLAFKSPRKKLDAYRIESGRNSITRQVLNKGLKVLVIDRVGKTYPPEEWDTMNVFWSGDQENLLIADNQTRNYYHASLGERNKLAYSAWHHR